MDFQGQEYRVRIFGLQDGGEKLFTYTTLDAIRYLTQYGYSLTVNIKCVTPSPACDDCLPGRTIGFLNNTIEDPAVPPSELRPSNCGNTHCLAPNTKRGPID